jgi:hypothetical protein
MLTQKYKNNLLIKIIFDFFLNFYEFFFDISVFAIKFGLKLLIFLLDPTKKNKNRNMMIENGAKLRALLEVTPLIELKKALHIIKNNFCRVE